MWPLTGSSPGMRAMVVDDHDLFANGLAKLLETVPGVQVVGVATSGSQALELADRVAPDLALMDIKMPGLDGIETTRLLLNRRPALKVVLLTVLDDDEYIVRGVKAGAAAYVLKDTTQEELVRVLRSVQAGGPVITPGVAGRPRILEEFKEKPARDRADPLPLTGREEQILKAVVSGCSTQEVADYLGIADKTVRNHISNIYRKLDLFDRAQLVLYAVRRGLIRLEET